MDLVIHSVYAYCMFILCRYLGIYTQGIFSELKVNKESGKDGAD